MCIGSSPKDGEVNRADETIGGTFCNLSLQHKQMQAGLSGIRLTGRLPPSL